MSLEVTATVTVKAEPAEDTFTVTYDGNGGTPEMTGEEVIAGANVETLPTVTRDGYIFVEWNTQPNGEGNVFTAETVIEADITVYAIWEEDEVADTFTVNVIVENGTVTGEGSYEEGTEVMLKAIPAEGYVFINWTDREDEVSTENPYTFIMSAEAVELLANFEEESEEIDVGMDTAPIDISIQAAENAKSDVVVSEDGQDVSAGTYWVTQGDLDTPYAFAINLGNSSSANQSCSQSIPVITRPPVIPFDFSISNANGIKVDLGMAMADAK
jgi:uncharacterized repeat protein (TIGR02543 family)